MFGGNKMLNTEKTMEKIVALCKGRGFIFAGSDIYGGLANTWDYGPLGARLKNNVKDTWRKRFIQETKIMASCPNTSWQIDGEKVETVSDFIFLGSQITADGDCSHEIKRHLLLGRKAMTNLDSISKSRDITLPTKVRLVKAMVFPVVMYGCESWTVKKAEH